MEMYLKITVGLLLLVQACHLASIPFPTDSMGRAIDKTYFRGLAKNEDGSENAAEETGYDQTADETALESTNEHSDGMVSDLFPENLDEENDVADQDKDPNEDADDPTFVTPSETPIFPTGTAKQPENPNTTMSQTIGHMNPTNASQIDMIDTEGKYNNSMTTPSNGNAQNTTGFVDLNGTDLHTSTLAHKINVTQVFTTAPGVHTSSIDLPDRGSPKTTTMITRSSSTPVFPLDTTEMAPTTTPDLHTSEVANRSDEDALKGSSSEIGLDSNSSGRANNRAWGAILGIVVAVACVGIVVYILLKKQHKKGFSHRKLVEEYHSDPVHRLDNGEPLDFSLGGSSYYNPGLQGDNIQMSNLPQRH
ncbi:mucin-15 [Antennarius striatus]|uniref:mucin-15 n=1 Tax=Antennarius striatus TaxID=241820 RepID=UPI0035B21F53